MGDIQDERGREMGPTNLGTPIIPASCRMKRARQMREQEMQNDGGSFLDGIIMFFVLVGIFAFVLWITG